MALTKLARRARIKMRVRKTVNGTTARPRLTVFRSNKHIYAQLVDDTTSRTLCAAGSSDKELAKDIKKGMTKKEISTVVGKAIAAKAKTAGVETVAFDRNGYLYHGRVQSLAEAAREGGLKF